MNHKRIAYVPSFDETLDLDFCFIEFLTFTFTSDSFTNLLVEKNYSVDVNHSHKVEKYLSLGIILGTTESSVDRRILPKLLSVPYRRFLSEYAE